MRIVKRRGHNEEFDERKIYASVFAACMNVLMSELESELVAEKVVEEVKIWLHAQGREVDSQELFTRVIKELEHLNEEVAFMYSTHRDIS